MSDAEVNHFYEQLASNYRQLVLNYERIRDFDAAEDFHIGEMEMRRIIAERTGVERFCWLLVWVLLIFPSAFMFAGFQRVGAIAGNPVRVIVSFRRACVSGDGSLTK